MVKVPQYEQNVALRPAYRQDVDVRATAESFGADIGRGMQRLGAGVGQLSQAALQVQQLEDQTRAKDADNDYSNWLRERMYGEGGFMTLEGRSAIDQRADFEREAEEKRKEFGAKLNGGAAKAYQTASQARLQSSYQQSIVHTAQQRKAWFTETSNARIETFSNEALANFQNPALVNKNIAAAILELREQGQMHGWDADTFKARESGFVSSVKKSVTLRIAQDDPLAADAYMKEAGDSLLEKDRFDLNRSLENPILAAKAQRNLGLMVDGIAPQKYDEISDRGRGPDGARNAAVFGPMPFKSVVSEVLGMNEKADAGAISDFVRRSAGVNIDPRVTPWCAAFVNAVLGAQGIEGTGKLNARSFMNFGMPTDSPKPGDVVVLARGTGEQGHVGFFQGFDDAGNILVLGGNQSDAVNVSPYSADKLLAFRTAGYVSEGATQLPNYGPAGLDAIGKGLSAITDPKEREATRKVVDAYYTSQKKAMDAQREQIQSWVEGKIMEQDPSFNPMELRPEIQSAIGMSGMTTLMNYQEKVRTSGQPKTDERVMYDLQMEFADDPEGFANVELFQFRDQLSNSDWEKVRGWQQTARNDRRKARNEGLKLSEAFGMARSQLNGVGIRTGDSKDGQKDAKRVAQFQNALASEMDEFKRANDGKNPTQLEIQSMINKLLLPIVIKEPGRFWGTNKRDGFVFDAATRSDNSTVDVTVEYDEIPIDLRRSIALDLEDELGRKPSAEEVTRRYLDFAVGG